MGIIPVRDTFVEDLRGALVSATAPGEGGIPTLYRVELITEQGNIPLAGHDVLSFRTFVSDNRAMEADDAARINAFVEHGEGTLEIKRE